jgi:aspartyl-tRNA(Asn)/glutamyl-tRNA(Gln) amidotransferase subunit A
MHRFTGFDLHQLFLKEELSAVEITQTYLKRIEKFNPHIQAFLAVWNEKALKKAHALDQKKQQKKNIGKLAGVPIAIKDNIHVLGEKTTCGSKFLSNYKAVFDATVIKYLEEEDAIILGKTNLDEFAMGSSTETSAFFTTKNPWDLTCSPGGSSGGSAAAVAARLAPIALGSDTGGSIRQPASFCGIVGFKPTYGRVSRYGLVAYASSLDQIGPLAANVKDTAMTMEVLAKHCNKDSTTIHTKTEDLISQITLPIKGSIIGIPWDFLEKLDKETLKNFKESLEVFKNLGCTIIEIDLNILRYAIAVYYILAPAEASTNLARFDGIHYGIRSNQGVTVDEVVDFSRKEGFGTEVKQRIMLGTYVRSAQCQESYYTKAQKVRTLFIQAYHAAFQKCQIIATPTSPFATFKLKEIQDPIQMYLQDTYTIPANLAGLPAISIPSGFYNKQHPLGLHLTGPLLDDTKVLRFAYHYEQQTNFSKNIPSLFDKG